MNNNIVRKDPDLSFIVRGVLNKSSDKKFVLCDNPITHDESGLALKVTIVWNKDEPTLHVDVGIKQYKFAWRSGKWVSLGRRNNKWEDIGRDAPITALNIHKISPKMFHLFVSQFDIRTSNMMFSGPDEVINKLYLQLNAWLGLLKHPKYADDNKAHPLGNVLTDLGKSFTTSYDIICARGFKHISL